MFEGSYASDPNDPYARIWELQDAIATYHQSNLSVIMDVVYNHVYQADEYAFEQIVPGYFYRYNAEGGGPMEPSVGMMSASRRSMVDTISSNPSSNGFPSTALMVSL